ncbi:MAG: hypothetical protein AAGI01_12675 [Myxococcota bacterium]
MSAALVLWTGLVAGSAHVVAGPDHLAAVLPLAAESRSAAARTGALWGLGHGIGVVALGAVGQALRGSIDIETVSHVSEIAVGLMLIGLGMWSIRRARLVVVHTHDHEHRHEDHEHQHAHVHIGDRTVDTASHQDDGEHEAHTHSALGFGLVHGTAGAGHLFGVMPSLMLPPRAAAVYLAAYLVSAIVAMTGFAWGVGRLIGSRERVPATMRATGAIAMAVGCTWVAASLLG